jgi:hypothetical protein
MRGTHAAKHIKRLCTAAAAAAAAFSTSLAPTPLPINTLVYRMQTKLLELLFIQTEHLKSGICLKQSAGGRIAS